MTGNDRLGTGARGAIADAGAVYVSAASAWEIAVKRTAGKLDAAVDLGGEIAVERFVELPITLAHAVASADLPPHHRDPFDRMLVAQAQLEDLTLVTSDPWIEKYDVRVLPAVR